MKIYVVEMLRYGDHESHHYIIGAYSTTELAQSAGAVERSWRGGKYEPRVEEIEIDNVNTYPLMKI